MTYEKANSLMLNYISSTKYSGKKFTFYKKGITEATICFDKACWKYTISRNSVSYAYESEEDTFWWLVNEGYIDNSTGKVYKITQLEEKE